MARILIRNEPIASYVQEALEGYASGRYSSQMEVKRYLETCPEFPKTKNKGREVHPDRIRNILTKSVYAGMVELPCRNITMRQGHHDGLIDMETFYKIQERLNGKSVAVTRKDANLDFALRGAVACADCNAFYTANWSKGRNKSYPYYICRTKNCASYGKSIKRIDMEDAFEELLSKLIPSKDLADISERMLRKVWTYLQSNKAENTAQLATEINWLESEKESLIDRLMNSNITSVIGAYEQRIQKMELKKIVLEEKIERCGTKTEDFDKSFRTALQFLANPHKIWASNRYEHKRAVLKLTFTDTLIFDRKSGFRTAAIASPFRALEHLTNYDSKMAEREGFEPSMGVKTHTPLAGERLQPLGHLSVLLI